MPKTKYIKPKNLVAFYYDGKELIDNFEEAITSILPKGKADIVTKSAEKFYKNLCAVLGANKVLLIAEQFPLHSMEARGKIGNLIYQKIGKTGTQYLRENVPPSNPKSPDQTRQRNKLKPAIDAWNKLSPSEKKSYNDRAENMHISGYNLFISEFLLNK